eukprot:749325-Hanusia_phi.AAC.2
MMPGACGEETKHGERRRRAGEADGCGGGGRRDGGEEQIEMGERGGERRYGRARRDQPTSQCGREERRRRRTREERRGSMRGGSKRGYPSDDQGSMREFLVLADSPRIQASSASALPPAAPSHAPAAPPS